ncbi:MAG: S41 family peptidase [Flavobacteriales bacterium]|nr:S41 family peptidase [Flavobacteriales bacterium]
MKNYILIITLLFSISFKSYSQEDETRSTHVKIERLLFLIEQMYVEEIDNNVLRENLVTGMLNSLRPFSIYQNEKFFIDHIIPKNKSIQSAGFSLNFKNGKIKIDSIYKNGGAELAKLSKGDEIIELDGNNLDEVYYYSDLLNLLVGETNSEMKAKYVRTSIDSVKENDEKITDTLETTITRKEIDGLSILPIGITNGIDVKLLSQYNQALKIFDELYPDTINNATITEKGIRYMLEQLDPHSTYVSLKDMHDMNAPLKGSFTGVGIRFQVLKDTIMVVQAIPGGPSEKVGIMAGDKMVTIQDENVAGIGISTTGVRDRLLGDKGTIVNVSIKRGISTELLDFSIERDKIPIYSVDASYMASPETGYIKLNNFSSTSLAEIRKAVFELKSDGMENLILDLQNNGGGYLRTAVELADELLAGNKKIVSTKGRKFPEKSYQTSRKGLLENGKIIVLVNESSASASEIVSGAIQDWDRGLIVGRRTFGKGLVQKPIDLPDHTQVRITTSKYYTPSGRCIQKAYEGGSVAYRREKYERYKSGESFNADSIKYDKEDIYHTKIKNREVYGGGGIMPDYFVALDTSGTSDYFNKLIRKGIFNQFALSWVNDNRNTLEKKYPSFNHYNKNFSSKKIINELIEYAEKEGLEYNEEEFLKAENTIYIRLKANIAQDLFDYKRFYQVINQLNTSLQKSLELMKDDKNFKKLAYNK